MTGMVDNGITVGVASLGCSKNRVDTELMLGELQKAGYSFSEDVSRAEVLLVNTCGFIESAKQESINTILELAEYKETGKAKALIVTGCLSGRYREELERALPEVDAFLGITPHGDIVEAVEEALIGKGVRLYRAAEMAGDYGGRVLTTAPWYAYVKISEGCNNRCAYCAIPYIRGDLKSRPMEDVVAECGALLARGVNEIILVAQDTTKYGLDLYGAPRIVELLEALAPMKGLKWLRLLYCYPDGITEELLETMVRHENIVKYLDMPIQHVDDDVLTAMNRTNTRETTYGAVEQIRAASPDFVLRTTLIAGFPGETEEAHEALKQGVKDLAFDRLGVFAYSREEGTPAAEMDGQVDEEIKILREQELMLLQQEVTLRANEARVGKVYDTVIEGYLDEDGYYYGRTYAEAPGIDINVYLKTEDTLIPGEFYPVEIIDATVYELFGKVVTL